MKFDSTTVVILLLILALVAIGSLLLIRRESSASCGCDLFEDPTVSTNMGADISKSGTS